MRQEGSWNLSLRRTRGQIKYVSAFSIDRCMDIKFDWNIPDDDGDDNHYDARVLRNCRPDSLFTSDGERDSWDNHDEYWVEPAGWGDGPNSNGVREVVAYVIDDGDPDEDHKYPVERGGLVEPDWYYRHEGDDRIYGANGPDRAPVTTGDYQSWFARTYVLRQSNDVQWSSQLSNPQTCPYYPDVC